MLNLSTPIQETRAYQTIFAEGKAEDLSRLLSRRFGTLPSWAIARIQAASIAQLNTWLDGIFDVDRPEGLIGPEQRE